MYTVVGNIPVVLATRGPDWSRWGGQNMSMFQGTSMSPRPATHTHQRPFLPSQQNTDGKDKGMVHHEGDPSLSGRPWPPLLLFYIHAAALRLPTRPLLPSCLHSSSVLLSSFVLHFPLRPCSSFTLLFFSIHRLVLICKSYTARVAF